MSTHSSEQVRRPFSQRLWFYPPRLYWRGWSTLLPIHRGADEFDWHTLVFGWQITGRLVVATRRCPQTGRCEGFDLGPDWPEGFWGFDGAPLTKEGLPHA